MTSLPPSDLPPVISPTKQALRYFLEKKEEEFKHLNGRLDVYIKKVQTLEDSKSQLTAEKNKLTVEVNKLKTSKETEIKEFELRIEYANQLYDKILQENGKNKALADEYEHKLNKEIKAHEVTEDALKLAQWKLSEKEGQLVARNQEIKNLEVKILERKKECQELLEMRAELVSKTKTHEKDIVEIRRQLQIAVAKRFEVESEMKTRYEEMLVRQLQELRNELETSHKSEYYELRQKYLTAVAELTTVQEEKRTWSINVENLRIDLSQWQSKCEALQQMHSKDSEELSSVREENRKLAIDIENLKLQIGQWESENASLILKIEQSETLREADNRRFEKIITQKDELIKEGKQWIVENHEYDENLKEVNQMLDSDIKDYRRMIEGEEGRLNTNRSTRRSLEFNSGTKEEATLIRKGVHVIRTGEAASQERTMETRTKATSQFYEEVTVIRTDESGTQEEATFISEEARVTRTDEGTSQEITMETSAEHHPPPSKIQ
ncbi:lamin-B3-like [Montipora foliosa]|uniref:lamin-B3-like n=1 Tax=Montipora foliosa TaxID=591990 RepID=UPI0035F16D76